MPAMVDVHCHVVYGVDDGARRFEDTQDMLKEAASQGVRDIVCTSHATPGEERFHYQTYLERIDRAQAWADEAGLDVRLHPGCEILYTPSAPRLLEQGDLPTLAGSGCVLVEFSGDVGYDEVQEAVRRIGNQGYSVILAHVERFACLRSLQRLRELRGSYGASLQMNAGTVCMKNGFFTDRWVRKVLEYGLIDMIGSDAHNTTSRVCRMAEAYDYLRDHYDEAFADELCRGNAARLLGL